MDLGERLINFVDTILDMFNAIKGYLENAVAFFEKLKNKILELLEYFTEQVEDITEENLKALEEEHFFI
ncbi:hypothetical protein HX045_15620 [Myroides odoratimimus]|uniref:Uncharacterized protein n=3 Tax=Myroides odoratimimus TaxID=76832 RepID=A0A0S7EKF6_9FLAO|nr:MULTISPECIES: hypothetical protein [Myroides]AJA69040.1 hypothetical protein MYRA21_1898 [Myroides sp. A21]ALU26280.1 hypothetical protein AS202_09015 [Myroides odoratimimus]APA92331.1 hypothetical protein BK054_08880 [Myroides sp. ZB35]EHO12244.1 hypothetical protein HMPREF9712_00491 [Myroides odoratimimus CCUG 10230]EHO13526.1 hypothetical protein HMPREF9714_00790 [Myroides odoratimimus CCUG 12901]